MAPNTNKEKRQERFAIVNQIINEISLYDRRFFYGKETGETASLFERNNKIYYKCEWWSTRSSKPIKEICMTVPHYSQPKGWFHGGTLHGLVKDFIHFIKTGDYSNHLNGYGGLYCPHWGYSNENMIKIQDKAIELGYLIKGQKP